MSKYIKWYYELCNSRKSISRSKDDYYYEAHHIKPKWLGGLDNKDNYRL